MRWWLASRSPLASYSATYLPIAVCSPKSNRSDVGVSCRIKTHALYSAASLDAPEKAVAPWRPASRAAPAQGWKRSPAVLFAYATCATFNRRVPRPTLAKRFGEARYQSACTLQREKGLLPQNNHVPELPNDSETGLFEFGHHKFTLFLPDEPGVRFQDDRVSILHDVHFMANQIVLQAFDITYEIEASESPIAHDLS